MGQGSLVDDNAQDHTMKTSNYLLATVRQVPADVEIVSHRLMLRAGMIRQLAAGIYNWLPTGLRVLKKVENIVREEMNRAGAQEVLMPSVQPAEIWRESERWDFFGPELLRFTDRHDRDFCLGPTHEEVITTLINNEVRSYRQLPANFYQMQWKFRDEIRPRFGVMRCREFLMKDAYSFDVDKKGMEQSYRVMYDAYRRVFDRLGLDYVAVEADSGAIGGSVSHEFHVLADSGEDGIGVNTEAGFASNIELIPLPPSDAARNPPTRPIQSIETPGVSTIEQLCDSLDITADSTLKTLLVQGEKQPVALVVRGDHELNMLKAENIAGVTVPVQFLTPQQVGEAVNAEVGSIGPVNLTSKSDGSDIRVVADYSVQPMSDFVCGANLSGQHHVGVNWERDVSDVEFADLRKAVEGDPCPGTSAQTLTVKRGIEVGHVFQLGTKYSEAFDATCLDADGRNSIMWMGCYGIGVSRIVAAAIEQNHDEAGIIWPEPIAPFAVCIVPINYHQSDSVARLSDQIQDQLTGAGVEVLLDDRDDRAGVKFNDMDLLGIPHRLVVSDRNAANGEIEYKHRTDEQATNLPIDGLTTDILNRIKSG
ncbi:MAG: proline--tRNA ligase [Acidiferrobacterales bacterium]|nr:proline--tRNA ligase [Acidiferrobacterales bacterium]